MNVGGSHSVCLGIDLEEMKVSKGSRNQNRWHPGREFNQEILLFPVYKAGV